MAKLCSPFGTSPISSFFNELTPNSFSDDFHHIQPDPFDFLEDLPSIYSDIQKIESDSVFPSYSSAMDLDFDIKPEIRNNDLMWSPAPPSSILSTSASSTSSIVLNRAVPLSEVMSDSPPQQQQQIKTETTKQQQQKPPAPTVVVARKLTNNNSNNINIIKQEIIIKQEPIDDVEQQLEHHSIPNSKTVAGPPTLMPTLTTTTTTSSSSSSATTNMQNIPPGTSLLRKSNQLQQQQKKLQQTSRGGTLHLTKRGDQLLPSAQQKISPPATTLTNNTNSNTTLLNTSTSSSNSSIYRRPDTPHSLDDDCSTSEFRHNVDLRACVMGSNNISLTADPTNFIQHVSQELQDTSKKQIDTRLISGCSLTEVMDVINNSGIQEGILTPSASSASTCSGGFNYSNVNTSGSIRSSEFDSEDEESLVGSSTSSLLDHDITYGAGGTSPVLSQSSNISSSTHHYMQHSDHSYTRCKDGMDDLSTNLETPSDSEEEIDVVSINDKKLPTNPSDKDRRALQTKVAHKFNAARIVKNPNGIRTIPPRRRGSYEFPYTPASSSPVKSVNNSRFPSPAATPFTNQYTSKYVQQQQQMMTVVLTDASTGAPINVLSTDKSRKRILANATANISANTTIINGADLSALTSVATMPPTKKHRGKKTKHLVTAVQLPNGILKSNYSLDETADTIEKRNLHNDMERQRRIGLKNLFESLKKQIPSIKDKERAPKVNILREAAKLCEALTREDQQLAEQKIKLKEELRRKQELLAHLRAHQSD